MHKLYKTVKICLILFLISMYKICAMEAYSSSDNPQKISLNTHEIDSIETTSGLMGRSLVTVRAIPHPACLPLYENGFECRRLLPCEPNVFLSEKYSNLIRMTCLNILALVDNVQDGYFEDKFAHLEDIIQMCVCVSEKWHHVTLPLFKNLEALYENSFSWKPGKLGSKVTKVVNEFIIYLKHANDIDGLEMRLLCMRKQAGLDVADILRVVRKLRRHNRDSIAVHYLLSLARQVENLNDSAHLCAVAQRLDVYPARAYKVMQTIIAEKSISTTIILDN